MKKHIKHIVQYLMTGLSGQLIFLGLYAENIGNIASDIDVKTNVAWSQSVRRLAPGFTK